MATQTLNELLQHYEKFSVALVLNFKRATSMGDGHELSMLETDANYNHSSNEGLKRIASTAAASPIRIAKTKAHRMASIFSSKNYLPLPESATLKRMPESTALMLRFEIFTSKPMIASQVATHILLKIKQVISNEIKATDYYTADAIRAWTFPTKDNTYIYGFWKINPNFSTITGQAVVEEASRSHSKDGGGR